MRRPLVIPAMAVTLGLIGASAALAGDGTFTAAPDSPIGVGSTPGSIAVGDFNKDGDPDLAVVNRDSSDLSLLIGAADAGFAGAPANVPLAAGAQAVVRGDFNNDSDDDLAVSSSTGNTVTILTGGAGANFTTATVAVPNHPTAMAIGDFNRDNDPDIAVITSQFSRVAFLVGGAGSSFTASPTTFPAADSPSAIAAADFSDDGDPDLAITSSLLNKVTVLIGGDGTGFTTQGDAPATGTGPTAITAADFNGDADPDLAVSNSGSDDVTVLPGATGPGFATGATVPAGDEPSALTAADFNGDGDPDLAVANQASTSTAGSTSVLLGGSVASFAAAPGSPLTVGARPLAIASGDFNGDGNQDLVTADGGADTLSILLGNAVVVQPPPGSADTTAPQTQIDSGPKPKTEKRKAKLAYSANEPATFECRLSGKGVDSDLGSFAGCGAAKAKYKHLEPGKKKFQVRATDAAGNIDPTPAKLKWKVLAG